MIIMLGLNLQDGLVHVTRDHPGAFREGEVLRPHFRISGRSFGPNFGFPNTFYTFSLLPQLKTGRSQPAKGDFFSQIAL